MRAYHKEHDDSRTLVHHAASNARDSHQATRTRSPHKNRKVHAKTGPRMQRPE